MGVLDVIRRVILRKHSVEHEEIEAHLADIDAQFTRQEVILRRLEIERRLREARLRRPPP